MTSEKSILARIVGAAYWLQSAEDPVLTANEQIVLTSLASSLDGGFPTIGRLVLTTQRLVYVPMSYRFLPKLLGGGGESVEINVSEIVALGRRSWVRGLWGAFPGVPPITIKLQDGTSHILQTILPGFISGEIQKLILAQGDGD